jgi:hypothetical protein
MQTQFEEVYFADVEKAVEFLTSPGWEITKTSFYRHQAEGKIRRRDRSYTARALKKYARLFLHRKDPFTLMQETLAKVIAENASEIIKLVSGDPSRVEALVSFCKGESLSK